MALENRVWQYNPDFLEKKENPCKETIQGYNMERNKTNSGSKGTRAKPRTKSENTVFYKATVHQHLELQV